VPKVFALHEVVLPPGMTAEEYEQLFGEELASLPDLEGWKTCLLKGDRGDSAGKLLLMFEIESVPERLGARIYRWLFLMVPVSWMKAKPWTSHTTRRSPSFQRDSVGVE
jgi:hypothetical protein